MARTYRLDPELVLRVEERAEELGQSLTVFVTRALEQALGDTGGGVTATELGPSAPVRAPEVITTPEIKKRAAAAGLSVESVELPYYCLMPTCDFRSADRGAVCPEHERKVHKDV